MKQLQLLDADGQPLSAFSFGEVPAGQLSAPLAVTLNGTPVTGTSLETATALPDLAASVGHAGTAEFTSPTVSVDSGTLHWQAD